MASKLKLSNNQGDVLTLENSDTSTAQGDRTLSVNNITHTVDTIAALQGMSEKHNIVYVTGYHTKDDGAFGSHFFKRVEDAYQVDNGGTIIRTVNGVYELQYDGSVNVKWFGVVGYVTTDDTEAVRAAHTSANLIGSTVSYQGLNEIAIDADAQIVINTSVDFANVKIYLLNGVETSPSYSTDRLQAFIVEDSNTPLVEVTGNVPAGSLSKGSSAPFANLYSNNGYALMETTYQISNREKDSTRNYLQSFRVYKDGAVNFPVSYDMDGYETGVKVSYRDNPSSTITIENIHLISDGWNHQTFLNVQRNKVSLNNVTVNDIVSITNSVDSLFLFSNVCDISINNISSDPRITSESAGTYVLSIGGGANINIINANFKSDTGWGATGCNEINGLYYTNCNINRYDVHSGCHNMFISNSTIGKYGVRYGWGGGTISIKDCVSSTVPLQYRGDYGGSFDGSFDIQNVIISSNTTITLYIVSIEEIGSNLANTYIPDINIRNIRRNDEISGTIQPVILTIGSTYDTVYAPKVIEIDSINGNKSFKFKSIVDWENMEKRTDGTNCYINIKNVQSDLIPLVTDGLLSNTNSKTRTLLPFFVFKVDNCNRFRMEYFNDSNYTASLDISNSNVCDLIFDTTATYQQEITVSNCFMEVKTNGVSTSTYFGGNAGGSSANFTKTSIRNCRFKDYAWNLSEASSIIGTEIAGTGANIILPSTATIATAFTGWK